MGSHFFYWWFNWDLLLVFIFESICDIYFLLWLIYMWRSKATLLASIPIFYFINKSIFISNLKCLFFFLLRVHLQFFEWILQLIELSILTSWVYCSIIEETIRNIQDTTILFIRSQHPRLIFLQRALLVGFGGLHIDVVLIWGILMIFLIINIILINPFITDFFLLTWCLFFIGFEVGSNLRYHREGVMHLLLEVRVLILQLAVLLLQLFILLFHFGV